MGEGKRLIQGADTGRVFSGSMAKVYDAYLVPLIFEPYAADLVDRLGPATVSRVLETAAGALALLYGEWISGGDFPFVAFTSLVISGLCYWLLYLPVLRAVRRWLPHRPLWVFALVAVLLGIVPTALVARFWGGSLRALLTPEAVLFYVLFAVVGLVIGVGFTHLDSEGP